MKKTNKIFALAMTFVMGLVVSSYAFEYEINPALKSEISNIIQPEIMDGDLQLHNRLDKKALSYLSENSIYTKASMFKYDCESTPKEQLPEMASKFIDNGLIPNQCVQFDVMNYLISISDNKRFRKALLMDIYDYRYIGNNVTNLFAEAVLSDNKEAINILYNFGLYERSYAEFFNQEARRALYFLAGGKIYDYVIEDVDAANVMKRWPFSVNTLKDKVINPNKTGLDELAVIGILEGVGDTLFYEYYKNEDLRDVLLELIDYRIEQGY